MRRKKRQSMMDRELLDAIFQIEAEWKKLRYIVDNSIEPHSATEQKLLLEEAKYMFLLREAKIRKISLLRY